MRRAIARARLCTHLIYQRRAKDSTPFLIKKTSRCAANRTSKTTTFSIAHFLQKTNILHENHVHLLYHWFSGENGMFTISLHKGRQTQTN